MPEREFQEYLAYHSENPIGPWREDFRLAQVASLITTGPLKKPLKPSELMVFWDDGKQDEDMLSELIKGAVSVGSEGEEWQTAGNLDS